MVYNTLCNFELLRITLFFHSSFKWSVFFYNHFISLHFLRIWYSIWTMQKMTFIKCAFCGSDVEKPLKEITRQHNKGNFRFYCGRECHIKKVQSGYSQTWQATHNRARYYFIKRLSRPLLCARCNHYSAKNQVHHINGNWRDNTPQNLQCLCMKCHPQADSQWRKSSTAS